MVTRSGREGYLVARTGVGTFVAPELPQNFTTTKPTSDQEQSTEQISVRLSAYVHRLPLDTADSTFNWAPLRRSLPYNFRYGCPSMVDFPHDTWCRLLAKRARRASIHDLDYGPPEGVPPLREAIADYLSRARSVRCRPGQVIITNGSQQALDIAARILIDVGGRVLLEEPHYMAVMTVMKAAGAEIKTIPVDEQGLCTQHLATKGIGCRLIVVTPSHQFPTGAVMPLARRLELLALSKRESAFIFEDDYDSEYRYSGRPIEAIQALDSHEAVLYAGTFSKVMFPSLRLGYIVVPEHLVNIFRMVKVLMDTGCPSIPQLALVDFIRGGFFERHLHRQRIRNAARRAVVLEAINRFLGSQVKVSGIDAGLHVLLWLPDIHHSDLKDLRQRARQLGVGVYPVAPFYTTPPPQAGLLLGYASLSEKEIAEGVRRLAATVKIKS